MKSKSNILIVVIQAVLGVIVAALPFVFKLHYMLSAILTVIIFLYVGGLLIYFIRKDNANNNEDKKNMNKDNRYDFNEKKLNYVYDNLKKFEDEMSGNFQDIFTKESDVKNKLDEVIRNISIFQGDIKNKLDFNEREILKIGYDLKNIDNNLNKIEEKIGDIKSLVNMLGMAIEKIYRGK